MISPPRDPAELRQGDLIGGIVFPIPKFSQDARVHSRYTSGSGSSVQVQPIYQGSSARPRIVVEMEAVVSYAAVLSQCCDVDVKQDPPPPSFVLCRVTPPPQGALRNPEWLAMIES